MRPKETFTDGAESIHFIGGLVRIDFASLQPNPKDSESPVPEIAGRLIMTPDGFLKTYSLLQRLADSLIKQGVLKKTEQQAPAASAHGGKRGSGAAS